MAGPRAGPGPGATAAAASPADSRPVGGLAAGGGQQRGRLGATSGSRPRVETRPPQVRSGRFISYSAEVQGHEGQAKNKPLESERNEGAETSNELQSLSLSEKATVVIELWWRFRVIGADSAQVGYYCETETGSPSSTDPQ